MVMVASVVSAVGFLAYQKLTARGDNGGMVQRLHPKSRKGFNLIEAAIVLGVVGLVIGGIWVASATFYRNYRAQQTLDGFLFIDERVGQVFAKTAITTNCDGWSCNVDLTPQQVQAMLGTPPAGWRFNADGTLDSPIFSNVWVSVYSSDGGDEDSNAIAMGSDWPGTTDEAACKTFGTLALKSVSKKVVFVGLESTNFTLGGGVSGGENYAYAHLDNGFSFNGAGLPDPLWAGGVAGCFWTEIDIARP